MSNKTAALQPFKKWIVGFVLAVSVGAVAGGYDAAKTYIKEHPIPIEAVVTGAFGTTALGYFAGRKKGGQ